jgi:cell division septum initiation protein DivIVA
MSHHSRPFSSRRLPRSLFGFDREATLDLVDAMDDRIDSVSRQSVEQEQQIREQQDRITELEQQLTQSQDAQRSIAEALIAARQEAKTIRDEARRQGEDVLRSAEKRAREITERAERAAYQRAKEMIGTAQRERLALLKEAGEARAFVEDTHHQLADFLTAAVKWYEESRPIRELGDEEPRVRPRAMAQPRRDAAVEPVPEGGTDQLEDTSSTPSSNNRGSITSATSAAE